MEGGGGGPASMCTEVLVRTKSGSEVRVGCPEQFQELQCRVCGGLVQNVVHAPCGHSFCFSHLEAGAAAWEDLEREAARLHELSVVHGFSVKRAREALAEVGDGDVAEAKKLCAKTSRLEGRAVRVRRDLTAPSFSWVTVTHDSVGVVMREDGDHVMVSFPECSGWRCLADEVEVEPVADAIREGCSVKLRAGKVPRRGSGEMGWDSVGTVASKDGCKVTVMGCHGQWVGFVDELESANTMPPPGSMEEAMSRAFARLRASAPPAPRAAQLAALLQRFVEAVESGDEACLVAQDVQHEAIRDICGAMDLLRAVGLEITRWNSAHDIVVLELGASQAREGVVGVSGAGEVAAAAAAARGAAAELEASFGPLPEVPPPDTMLYKTMLHIDPDIFASGMSFEELYRLSLRSIIVPAMSPMGEFWAWQQRGWSSETQMAAHLERTLHAGCTEVAKKQSKKEAEKIAQRIRDNGLEASVEEESLVLDEAIVYRTPQWVGDLPRGARVLFKRSAIGVSLPKDLDPASVGVIINQVTVRSKDGGGDTLRYYVQTPTKAGQPALKALVPRDDLEPSASAELIQPGVKVRVSPGPGRDPTYGWGSIQSSDVGVVHRVLLDGVVEVFFPTEGIWRGSLQDLDTSGLPEPVRKDCPVCGRPFPSGQRLATDIAVDAQIRRLQSVMAGVMSKNNGAVEARVQLLRTQSHIEEVKCNICFDLLLDPVTLPCGHSYCKHHIQVWLRDSDVCPVCRVRIRVYTDKDMTRAQPTCPVQAGFDAMLETPEEAAAPDGQTHSSLELHINGMLQTQVSRFFPKELSERRAEAAAEVWEIVQKKQDVGLRRLRAFLHQFRAPGASALLRAAGSSDPNLRIPGTRDGTLLMLASELGLADVVADLLQARADPERATSTPFGFGGVTALQFAAGQGHKEVVAALLLATTWSQELIAEALGAAIERGQPLGALLAAAAGTASGLETRNHLGLTPLLTAARAHRVEAVRELLARRADAEARTSGSALIVHGAGWAAANGPYLPVGEHEGRTMYGNARGAVIYCDRWWKLAASKAAVDKQEGHLYSVPTPPREDSSEPYVGQWSLHGGKFPSHSAAAPPLVLRLTDARHTEAALPFAARWGTADVAAALAASGALAGAPALREAIDTAAAAGHEEVLSVLLDAAAGEPPTASSGGLSPLSLACHHGRDAAVRLLLKARADPAMGSATPWKGGASPTPAPSPLLLAASCGTVDVSGEALASEVPSQPTDAAAYEAIVTALLEARADPAVPTAASTTPLHAAASAGLVGTVEELLRYIGRGGADVTAVAAAAAALDGHGMPVLMAALEAGAIRPTPDGRGPQGEAAVAIVKARADGNAMRDRDGVTALMLASCLGDAVLVRELVGAGADVAAARRSLAAAALDSTGGGSSGSDQESAVLYAPGEPPSTSWEHLDTLLRFHGARLAFPGEPLCPRGHRMQRLTNPLYERRPVCDICKTRTRDHSKVFWTCWDCDHDYCLACAQVPPMVFLPPQVDAAVVRAAAAAAADPDAFADGAAAEAVRPLPPEVASAVGHGALRRMDLDGWQALHYAAACGRRDAMLELLTAGASLGAATGLGMTPLHLAALFGRAKCVEALLEQSADPTQVDGEGRTALALLPREALRFAFAAEEASAAAAVAKEESSEADITDDEPTEQERAAAEAFSGGVMQPRERRRRRGSGGEVLAHLVEVTGAGPGDGTYAAYTVTDQDRAREARPTYRRVDGLPFIILWDETWALCQVQGPQQVVRVLESNDREAKRCPTTGWAWTGVIQRPATIAGDAEPRFADALPWRAGAALLAATPEALRPEGLREEVDNLPARQPPPGPAPGFGHIAIQVPSAMLAVAAAAAAAGGAGPPGPAANAAPGRAPGCPMQ